MPAENVELFAFMYEVSKLLCVFYFILFWFSIKDMLDCSTKGRSNIDTAKHQYLHSNNTCRRCISPNMAIAIGVFVSRQTASVEAVDFLCCITSFST